MSNNERIYKGKDVEMLTTGSVIIDSAIANEDKLVPRRSIWAPPYFTNFRKRIDSAFQNHLGIDNAKDQRQATQLLTGIQTQGLKDLALVKVQVDEDFKREPTRRIEILKQLGFSTYLKDAQRKDQEALINLLFMFKQNLPGLRAEIEAKGTDKTTLDAIVGYADTLKNANISQETFKGSKKVVTAEAIAEFNEIYDELIRICKIAAKFFTEEPKLKDQFTYSKVLKALNFKPGDGGGGAALN